MKRSICGCLVVLGVVCGTSASARGVHVAALTGGEQLRVAGDGALACELPTAFREAVAAGSNETLLNQIGCQYLRARTTATFVAGAIGMDGFMQVRIAPDGKPGRTVYVMSASFDLAPTTSSGTGDKSQ